MHGQDCGLQSNQVGGKGKKKGRRRRRSGCEINMTVAQSVAVWKERSASRAQSRGADEWVAIGAPSISLKTQFKKKSICGGTKKEWFRAEGQLRPGWTAEWRNDSLEVKETIFTGFRVKVIFQRKRKKFEGKSGTSILLPSKREEGL